MPDISWDDVTDEELIATERDQYMSSLYLFAKYCLGYLDLTEDTHLPIAEALQQTTKRKLICVPRGCFKSTLSTIAYPMWMLLHNPNLRILIDSELYSNSKNFLREIKAQYESNAKFRRLFGDAWKGPMWNEGEVIMGHRTKPLKEPSIACSGIGAGKTSQHYDCLVKGSMIYTSNGWKPIESLRKGIRVLGMDGKFHSIVATQKKISSKRIVKIRSQYQPKPLELTEDHRLWIYRDGQFMWSEAHAIKSDDKLCFPRISGFTRQISKTNERINNLLANKGFWRFIGYWLAEGCHTTNSKYGIRLTFGAHEERLIDDCAWLIEKFTGKKPSIRSTESSTKIIIFSDKEIKEILSKFGTHAYNKHLPPFVLNGWKEYQRELLIGYFQGDGCAVGEVINFASTSLDLLSGVQIILADMEIASGVSQNRKEGKSTILGNKVNIKDAYQLTSTDDRLKDLLFIARDNDFNFKPTRSFFTDKYWVVPIQDLDTSLPKEREVYDIQVADVESFVTMAGVAHNCIIADDLSSYQNCKNPDLAAKTIDHYRLYTSLLEPDGTTVVIGTRYSENDIIGFIIENELEIKDGNIEELKKLYCGNEQRT